MAYDLVFDVAQAGYRSWPPVTIGIGFTVIGGWLIKNRRWVPVQGPRWFRSAFPFVFFGVACCWTAAVVSSTYLKYRSLTRALQDGRVSVVEGPVDQFVPMAYTGHSLERFSVAGITFAYSDFVVTGGFNNTSSHGGPIRLGRYIRVTYVGEDIVRLEIRR